MGLLARVLKTNGPTHGRPPCSSLSSQGDVVPMIPNFINNPSSAWNASFNPNQSNLPALVKLPSALFDLE
jgi:hypothetical protein